MSPTCRARCPDPRGSLELCRCLGETRPTTTTAFGGLSLLKIFAFDNAHQIKKKKKDHLSELIPQFRRFGSARQNGKCLEKTNKQTTKPEGLVQTGQLREWRVKGQILPAGQTFR